MSELLLTDFDLHLLAEGTHYRTYEKLGAHLREVNGVAGVHFAVCQMATRRFAGAIAAAHKLDVEAVYKELSSNLVRNSHMVAAGIVAVNRAQERGYAFANAG